MERMYGYARVSSRDQNEDRQLISLKEYGVHPRRIYTDKLSGANFERPQYRRLVYKLKPGEVMVVQSIDRLGRNYADILEQWRHITREKRAHIVVLDMPLLDTRDKGKDLTGIFISELVLQILSYVAEAERNYIKKRQAEGIAAARLRGVRFGPPCREKPAAFLSFKEQWENGLVSARAAARELGIAPQTFTRWCGECKSEECSM